MAQNDDRCREVTKRRTEKKVPGGGENQNVGVSEGKTKKN